MHGTDKHGQKLQHGDEIALRCTIEAVDGDWLTVKTKDSILAGERLHGTFTVNANCVEKQAHEPISERTQHQTAGAPGKTT